MSHPRAPCTDSPQQAAQPAGTSIRSFKLHPPSQHPPGPAAPPGLPAEPAPRPPSASRSAAMALPMPVPPPVTMATRPRNSPAASSPRPAAAIFPASLPPPGPRPPRLWRAAPPARSSAPGTAERCGRGGGAGVLWRGTARHRGRQVRQGGAAVRCRYRPGHTPRGRRRSVPGRGRCLRWHRGVAAAAPQWAPTCPQPRALLARDGSPWFSVPLRVAVPVDAGRQAEEQRERSPAGSTGGKPGGCHGQKKVLVCACHGPAGGRSSLRAWTL